jgi:hypothetical protein
MDDVMNKVKLGKKKESNLLGCLTTARGFRLRR